MDDLLYKYRGITNFRFFVDIVLKSRLFAAKYKDLNDPMEGQYYYNRGEINEQMIRKLAMDKGVLRLCSLSKTRNNELMWSHYAEGHHGVAVGLTIDRSKYDVKPIIYDGLAQLNNVSLDQHNPRYILSHKLNVWSYEEEERVFVSDLNYVEIQVKEVITGRAMSNQDYSFIRDLLGKIDPSINLIKASSFM